MIFVIYYSIRLCSKQRRHRFEPNERLIDRPSDQVTHGWFAAQQYDFLIKIFILLDIRWVMSTLLLLLLLILLSVISDLANLRQLQ